MTEVPLTTRSEGKGGRIAGHLAMFTFAALVAGSFSIGSLAAPHVGSAAVNALRFALGSAIMGGLCLLLLRGGMPRPRAEWRFALLGGLMAIFFVTMFVALRISDPVSTGAVFTLMPVLGTLFGWMLLRQVPSPLLAASLVLAGLGAVWVIFGGDIEAILSFDIGRGEAIFFVGVGCHALYAPLVRLLNRGEPVLAFTFWTLVATFLGLATYGFFEIVETDWASLPAIVWIAVGYLAVFTTAGTFFLLQFAAMRLPSSKVLAYTYLTPTIIILIEGTIGHGWAPPRVLAGALVTVLGLVILAIARD